MDNKKHLRELNILKYIAIIAVIIYHIDIRSLPGGFIGVDLFLVLSGYLTTTSLMRMYENNNKIELRKFLSKRIRKLVPALFAMIFFVLIFLVLFNKPLLKTSHTDAVSGMTFTSNIWYIIKKLDYFDSFATSPFKHLWYLGVQVQMYVVLAILVKIFGPFDKNKRLDKLTVTFSVLAILSLLAHVLMFRIDNINRIYYGTDTRAFEILIGALGAKIFPFNKLLARKNNKSRIKSDLIATISLVIFVYLAFNLSEYSMWLYQGGFALIAVLCFMMIISIGSYRNSISQLLSIKPLLYLGTISYGLYLWHFPILTLTKTSGEVGEPNILLTIIRLIAILLISIISYNYLEKRIVNHGIFQFLKASKEKLSSKSLVAKRTLKAAWGCLSLLFVMGLLGISFPYTSEAFLDSSKDVKKVTEFVTGGDEDQSGEQTTKTQSENESDHITKTPTKTQPESEVDKNTETPAKTQPEKEVDKNTETPEKTQPESEVDKNTETPAKTQPVQSNDYNIAYKKIVVIGDSMAIDAGPAIKKVFSNSIVDAKVGRQLYKSASVAAKYASHDSENTAVIFYLGTNGFFTEEQVGKIVAPFKKSDIFLVNVKMPDSWEDRVNKTLASYVSKHPEITLVDWYSVAKEHPEYLAKDKTHMMKSGIKAMINILFDAMNKKRSI